MKRFLFVSVLALIAAGCKSTSPRPTTRQADESFVAHTTYRYLQYVPPQYASDPTNKIAGDGHGWPLVLFLHGSGEAGDNLDKVKVHGPPMLVEKGQNFPFILISPQAPRDCEWVADQMLQLLDKVENDLHVDRDRVYVTGLSMGGYGTYSLAGAAPDRFAAVAPICGSGEPDDLVRHPAIKSLPIWSLHGADDTAVPIAGDQAMIDALKKAGNPNVTFTIFPGATHNVWTRSYNDPAFYAWLMSHKRGVPSTQPAALTAK